MAETMADPKDNLPKEDIAHAYSKWAQGGWGLIMTGENLPLIYLCDRLHEYS
jgi:2,4-dienoyl-CoA reductase-like NADH-dependent reductase (Old Yellow Enzyme family)